MKIVLAYVAMISCTVIANLLFKTGAMSAAKEGGWLAFVNLYVIAGMATFAVSAGIYIIVLQWLPLNIAQSYLSAQFVAVVIASALVLAEPIAPLQWAGVALIAAGMFLVGHASA